MRVHEYEQRPSCVAHPTAPFRPTHSLAPSDLRRASLREWKFASAIAVAYLAVAAFATVHHEMWRDELHCWLVARDSANPWQVVHARAYDGQPPLWYLLLWLFTRLTWHPEVMRVLHVAIATADVLVVARFAPFGRAPRALFAFGYFVVYEYAAISRCYGLALLFALLLCVNHPRRFARPIVTGLLLAALALTTTVATLVAAAYAAALVVDWIAGARRRDQYTRRGWIPVALAVSGGLAAALCAWPPADSTVAHVGHPPRDLPWDFAPTRLVAALVPIPRADFFFWNSNALLEWSPLEHVRFALALALFAWIVFALSRDRFATILFGAGVVLLVALFAGVYPGDARHHGFLFVLFLMAAWIAWSTKGRTLAPTLALVLFVHVPAAAIAIAYDARYVFSSGRRAAEALRARGLQDALLVAEVDYAATAVLGQLGPHAQAYSPRTGRAFSFVRWTRDRLWDPTEEQTLRFAATLGSAHAADAVLVMNRPLLPELIDGARVTRLAEEYDSMIEEENFYIYRVKRDP